MLQQQQHHHHYHHHHHANSYQQPALQPAHYHHRHHRLCQCHQIHHNRCNYSTINLVLIVTIIIINILIIVLLFIVSIILTITCITSSNTSSLALWRDLTKVMYLSSTRAPRDKHVFARNWNWLACVQASTLAKSSSNNLCCCYSEPLQDSPNACDRYTWIHTRSASSNVS